MPLLRWKCPKCNTTARALVGPGETARSPRCGSAECMNSEPVQYMDRDTGGSTSVMETRDNGAMVRKLERYVNAEDLVKSHADSKKGPDGGIV